MKTPEIAESIVKQLKQIVGDDPMWSVADIANFMGMSKKSVADRIVVKPDFPVSIRIPYGKGSRTGKRWYPHEVQKWISRHRSQH